MIPLRPVRPRHAASLVLTRQRSGVTQILGHGGSIKVRTQGYVINANALGNVAGVAHNLAERGLHIAAAILAQKANVIVNADDAARFAYGIQLFVG